MKRKITFIIAAVIMIAAAQTKAITIVNPLKNFKTLQIVQTYLEASTMGNTKFNNFLFSKDFQFTNSAAQKTYSKSEYLKYLSNMKNLQLNCTNSYEILDETEQACVAKVTMNFANFSRVDYITLCRQENGWKITKVVSTYPET
ncbi:MAG: nuclear transport factor 2 family protein [Sphingobacterium sp.]